MFKVKNERGQLVAEVMLAVAIATLIIAGAAALTSVALQATRASAPRVKATRLAEEALSALRAVRDSRWNDLDASCSSSSCGVEIRDAVTNAVCTAITATCEWRVKTNGSTTHTLDGVEFTRTVKIEEAGRDNIGKVSASSTWNDYAAKKITVTISWVQNDAPLSLAYVTILSRFRGGGIFSSDWSQGAGGCTTPARAYVLGGASASGYSNQIFAYDPGAGGTVSALSATLPSGRASAAAVWGVDPEVTPGSGSGVVYLFGGYNGSYLGDVVKVNPGTGAVSTVASFPDSVGLRGAVAVWDNKQNKAFIIGGKTADAAYSNRIYVFSASNNTVTKFPNDTATFANAAAFYPAVLWDDEHRVAYIVGGESTDGRTNKVFKFDPYGSGNDIFKDVTPLGSANELPSIAAVSGAWDSLRGVGYLFGGTTGSEQNAIYVFDPARKTLKIKKTSSNASEVLSQARAETAAIWSQAKQKAYVFGGRSSGSPAAAIEEYTPGTTPTVTQANLSVAVAELGAVVGTEPKFCSSTGLTPDISVPGTLKAI